MAPPPKNLHGFQYRLADLLATGFGLGRMPLAPGTWGSLLGLPIGIILNGQTLVVLLLAVVVLTLMGTWAIGQVLARDALTASPTVPVRVDRSEFVWDEVVGMAVAISSVHLTWQNVLIGFILFRMLDVIKPWPIAWVDQKLKTPFGVMADDILAGLWALALLHWLQPWLLKLYY